MARPSPSDRRKIEARRKTHAVSRAEQADRDAQIRKRVEGLLDNALNRSRSRDREMLPDVAEIVEQLAEARMMALSVYPPQTQAAINASMATAKLLGYIIDKSAVAVGSPQDFQRTAEEIEADMREAIGDAATERFMMIYEITKRADAKANSVIEAEYRRLRGGSADGGDDGRS